MEEIGRTDVITDDDDVITDDGVIAGDGDIGNVASVCSR